MKDTPPTGPISLAYFLMGVQFFYLKIYLKESQRVCVIKAGYTLEIINAKSKINKYIYFIFKAKKNGLQSEQKRAYFNRGRN